METPILFHKDHDCTDAGCALPGVRCPTFYAQWQRDTLKARSSFDGRAIPVLLALATIAFVVFTLGNARPRSAHSGASYSIDWNGDEQ